MQMNRLKRRRASLKQCDLAKLLIIEKVAELEKTYLNLLKNNNIEHTSDVSRFCESLLESIPEVQKPTIKKNFTYFIYL